MRKRGEAVVSKPRKSRVLLITNIVIPYRLPVQRQLARQEGIDLHVCYLGKTEGIRRWDIKDEEIGFAHSYLPGIHFFVPLLDWGLHLNIGLLWKFIRLRPDYIVCTGWDCPAYYVAVFYAMLFRIKRVLWSGTSGYRQMSRKRWVQAVKRGFIRCFNAYLSYGSAAADYLVEHGAARDKIAVGYNTVDVPLFMKKADEARRTDQLETLRRQYPGKVILYVGRFLEFKRVDLLLDALAKMKQGDWTCLLIGWGPEGDTLRARCEQADLKGKVHFLDYLPPEQLAPYYALARAFVLPSRWEPWGLVVNEAMACGAPVVVSQGAGCARDLIEEERTGFSYPWDDTDRLAEILDRLMRDDTLYEALSRNGREQIRRFTPERYAGNLARALFELA